MKVDLKPGKYVVAVSGGVDSMVLLDILRKKSELELVIAHFNHGIRPEAEQDEAFVKSKARIMDLAFESAQGKLGANASEEAARQARYSFLERVARQNKAKGIITAHHEDDLIETALLNVLRGTRHRGLVAIKLNKKVYRPLLKASKKQLLKYAKQHNLEWREDPSNENTDYTRNYLRIHTLPKLTEAQRHKILINIEKVAKITPQVDEIIATLSHATLKGDTIDRNKFILLPNNVATELITHWLRSYKIEHDRKMIDKLSLVIKSAPSGSKHDIKNGFSLLLTKNTAKFVNSR